MDWELEIFIPFLLLTNDDDDDEEDNNNNNNKLIPVKILMSLVTCSYESLCL